MHMQEPTGADATAGLKLAIHNRHVGAHDKFVEYIRHIESKLQLFPTLRKLLTFHAIFPHRR